MLGSTVEMVPFMAGAAGCGFPAALAAGETLAAAGEVDDDVDDDALGWLSRLAAF